MTSTHHPLWTEGVCDDGAAILCDGTLVSISDVLLALNHREALRVAWTVTAAAGGIPDADLRSVQSQGRVRQRNGVGTLHLQ